MIMKNWFRSHYLPLIACVFTVLAVLVAILGVPSSGFLVPEIRRIIGLDKTNEVFIHGQWNEEKASQTIIDLMKRNPQKIDYKRYSDNDIVVNFYHLAYINKTSIVAIAYPIEGGTCHSCGVEFSIFELGRKDENWILENFYIDAFEDGYGGEPPNSIKILPIGYSQFGVVTEKNNMMYQGVRMTSTAIF